jgi:hypothetical protein
MPRLPDIPDLRCEGCGGHRFIPLTFRRSNAPPGGNSRPSAKCVDCGMVYCSHVGRTEALTERVF